MKAKDSRKDSQSLDFSRPIETRHLPPSAFPILFQALEYPGGLETADAVAAEGRARPLSEEQLRAKEAAAIRRKQVVEQRAREEHEIIIAKNLGAAAQVTNANSSLIRVLIRNSGA